MTSCRICHIVSCNLVTDAIMSYMVHSYRWRQDSYPRVSPPYNMKVMGWNHSSGAMLSFYEKGNYNFIYYIRWSLFTIVNWEATLSQKNTERTGTFLRWRHNTEWWDTISERFLNLNRIDGIFRHLLFFCGFYCVLYGHAQLTCVH